jgi:hypothetical protein
MRCFDDLDGSPTEKCMVKDVFNDLQYYDSCKKGKVCTTIEREALIDTDDYDFDLEDIFKYGETANYGVCAPLPYGGFEGAVCGDNAECFSYNCDGTSCGEPKEFCKMHSECKKGQYCDNKVTSTDGKTPIQPTYQCKDLITSGCLYDYQCPPLQLCHLSSFDSIYPIGSCKKIGSVDGQVSGSSSSVIKLNLLCKSGYSIKGYCVTEAKYNCVTEEGSIKTEKDSYKGGNYCRPSLLDGSLIPIVSDESIKAFQEYTKEVNDVDAKPDKKHANYGTIRYHYDKSKLKETLTKALYYELNKEDDETAECLLDYVKQVTLSGEKINFSKILVLTFALLLI